MASPNRIILGLMTFGPSTSDETRITTQEEFAQILDTQASRGYMELDTARMYADKGQEAWTREAGWKGRGFQLATKIQYPTVPGGNSAEEVKKSLETSLAELGTDCVDIVYLHAPDRATPFHETLGAINELYKAGKFRAFGLSNFTAFELAEIVMTCKSNGWVRPTIFQAMYNAIIRGIEPELVPACRRYGLDIVVYNPLCAGLFSGKIKTKDMVPVEGRFSGAGNMGVRYRDRYFRDSIFEALQVIEKATEDAGLSMVETALRWITHHSALKVKSKGGNDGVIIGVSSHDQVISNLDNLEKGPLPEKVVPALDRAWALAKADAPVYWHKGAPEYTYDTVQSLFGGETV